MIYVIQTGDYLKIGRSGDYERREKELRRKKDKRNQYLLERDARLLLAIYTDDDVAAETALHRHFEADRKPGPGELFKVPFSEVLQACQFLGIVKNHAPRVRRQGTLPLDAHPPIIHREFRRWFVERDWRGDNPYARSPEEMNAERIADVDANLGELWARNYKMFESDVRRAGSVQAAIDGSRANLEENAAFFASLREITKREMDEKDEGS